MVEFKVQCLKVFSYHGNKSTILLFIQFLEQLLKFIANFTLLKYVKSQRSYGFLITKELIFGFQILNLKDHFSASLKGLRARHRNAEYVRNGPKKYRYIEYLMGNLPIVMVYNLGSLTSEMEIDSEVLLQSHRHDKKPDISAIPGCKIT